MWDLVMRALNAFLVFTDILDDYKVVLLNDALKWRFVSACALAQRTHEDGYLPNDEESAVALRITTEQFKSEMSVLAQRGLVELRQHPAGEERWFVTNFAKRQSAASGTERSRNSRARKAAGEPVDNSRSGWSGWLVDLDQLDLSNQLTRTHCNDIATIRCNVEAFQQCGIARNRRTEALAAASHVTPDYIHAAVKDARGNLGQAIWRMENQAVPVVYQEAHCTYCGGNHTDEACAYNGVIQR